MNIKFSFAIIICSLLIGINLRSQTISSHEYNILRFGAKSDGKTINTKFIQKAIDKCTADGGGTVVVPFGTFVTGMLELKDNVTLKMEKGSVIQSSIDIKDFPTRWQRDKCLISMNKVSNVSIIGEGTLDGRGDKFTVANEAPDRPFVVFVQESKNIHIADVTLKNAARWTLRLLGNEHVFIRGVTIYSQMNYNNDGIDIDSKDVVVSDCIINCDDDAICLKSDSTGICENVVVTNCIIRSNRNFIKFGTSSFGGFRNIAISNITMDVPFESHLTNWNKRILGVSDSITGITGIVLEIVDGGQMDRVTISNISMNGVQSPIFIRLGRRTRPVGSLKNVLISNVVAKTSSLIPSIITAVPGSFIENVTFRDIIVYAKGGGNLEQATRDVIENEKGYPENRMFGDNLPGYGLYIRHAKNIVLDNVQFFLTEPDYRSAIYLDDAHDVRIRNFKADKPEGTQPLIYQIRSSEIDSDKNYN
ncbi:MAG: glycosyl hydrolase family 28 protein [Ignavibacteriaceae bacterium]|nr:glycosyl hydrolase family 28 protein [Ignavibacteriaceae bacterium]